MKDTYTKSERENRKITGYLTRGVIFKRKDVSVVFGNTQVPVEITLNTDLFGLFVSCDQIYVDGDFNNHDLITVQLGTLSNGLEPEDIDCYSHFEIDVQIFENEETDLQIKDRNFKLEDLSMELQARIVKVAEEMRADKMKFIND